MIIRLSQPMGRRALPPITPDADKRPVLELLLRMEGTCEQAKESSLCPHPLGAAA